MRRAVMTVMGTRPEVIKLAPVIRELERRPNDFASIVCVTGQHRDMLDQTLEVFGISPAHDLNIMTAGQSLAQVTERAIAGFERLFEQERSEIVLVQGDTTTALCGALVGYYHQVTVGHVEAGLRTGHKYAPFPEEGNRRLIGQIADYHFAPTTAARAALVSSGVPDDMIFVTGNTVIDALLLIRSQVSEPPASIPPAVVASIGQGNVVLVTGHRRESFGEDFENICRAIRDVADAFSDVTIVYPVHLNPNVQEPVCRVLGDHPRIHLIEPLPYQAFVWLMDQATLVLTDSGGVQEEAPSLGKPVLVMRKKTERQEGIAAGNAVLVGVQRESIAGTVGDLLRDPGRRAAMGSVANPYGDGHAAARIVDVLQDVTNGGAPR